jgi:ABC-type dipeptide/oligopeptide/nickel transport system ATPase component
VVVLHKGRVVESGPAEQVLLAPEHEYTKLLLSALPASPVGRP